MSTAKGLQELVVTGGEPAEFVQGNYRLRVMPGAGRIRDVSFSVWERGAVGWEPIVAGWARGDLLIVSSWRSPGSPVNAERLVRFVLAGKRVAFDDSPRPVPGPPTHTAHVAAP
jgi:hypothetical protein